MIPLSPLLLLAAACTASPRPVPHDADLVLDPPPVVSVDPFSVALVPLFGDDGGFQRPVDAAQAPGDPDAWYVVEQRGMVFRMAPDGEGGWERSVFLDIRERTSRVGNEEGLLGLAFSPHWGAPGHPHERAFYVNYSMRPGPRSRLARFFAGPGGGPTPADSEQTLLEVAQPWRNHNGGGLLFGPDGHLYYSLGDGGAGGDPNGNGQDPSTLLGTILRLDVDPTPDGAAYRIPADNPLAGRDDAQPEVYAYGLRNAWRFSFDRETGEMWAGDVGQNKYEWIVRIEPGGNHGWNKTEGFHRFALPEDAPAPTDIVAPIHEYSHPVGLSVTGGFVYRGSDNPSLRGWYVFGDYVTRKLWAVRVRDDGSVEHAELGEAPYTVASFAEDHEGELYVVTHIGPGAIYRIDVADDEEGDDP